MGMLPRILRSLEYFSPLWIVRTFDRVRISGGVVFLFFVFSPPHKEPS